ncbi:protein kinase domain protein [Ichthyophthirius multifiliis]|uniref:Protein kinase domain protein n=1 Tax=Ichthyophthirius multifiliis TaxID=5932 RepID=G0QUU7_ICHMU|nr:protein kinase domain protein [Ichthyophthirius multifiliis]EGR31007.1 protein kinase domain protein [Ichthyophthirius multifiliis]|eukprot:XP_004034493.1 protein kinase domain protein [Ichthyophthirius multifiliis]
MNLKIKSLSPQQKIINDLQQLDFQIYLKDKEIKIQIQIEQTIGQLIKLVKQESKKLSPIHFQGLVYLETFNGNEVADYYLTQEDKPIFKLKNITQLKGVYQQKLNENQSNQDVKIQDFSFLKCLGKGGTSDVFLVRHKESCKLFALKMISKTHLTEFKRLEQLLRERKILIDASKTPFIATLHCCFESNSHLNFLLEFYCGGELFFHLQNKKLSESESKFYFSQILICFEDLKPENIVLDVDGYVHLTDFGLSKIGMNSEEMTDSFCGSPEYMAPEVLARKGYNYSVDFYTLGAFLHELVTGLPPFYSDCTETILNNIANQELIIPQYLNNDLKCLLYQLLDKKPQNRIKSFEQIKKSKWLKDVNWIDIEQCLQPYKNKKKIKLSIFKYQFQELIQNKELRKQEIIIFTFKEIQIKVLFSNIPSLDIF